MSRTVTFFERVTINSTDSATSIGCIRLPLASASSILAFGQSSSRAVTTGPGSTAPTRTPYCATATSGVHKCLHREFRRGIDRLPDHRHHARDRAGEDNIPGFLRDQMRQDAAHAAEGGVDIEVQHAVPDVRVALGHRPADIGAGVGVEDIETPGKLQNALQ